MLYLCIDYTTKSTGNRMIFCIFSNVFPLIVLSHPPPTERAYFLFAISSLIQFIFSRSLLYTFPLVSILELFFNSIIASHTLFSINILSIDIILPIHSLARLNAFDIVLVGGGLNVQFSNRTGETAFPKYGSFVPMVCIAASNSLVILLI